MHEAAGDGDGFDGGDAREVFTQLFDAQLAEFVVQIRLGRRTGEDGLHCTKHIVLHVGHELLRHGWRTEIQPRLRSEIDDIAFENRANFHPPLFAHRQGAAALNRPEPQGAPVVHDQLQSTVRGGQVAIVVEQAFFAGFLF